MGGSQVISFSWEELHAQRNKVKATRLVENYSCPGGNQDKALSIKGIKSPTKSGICSIGHMEN